MLIMTRESLGIDSYIHVYNRGVKKLPIYRQRADVQRLLCNLYYFNHADRMPENWKREIEMTGNPSCFQWPDTWGERQPIVSILAFSIMPNHLHLMIKEIVEGGTSKFMHRVSMAYSKFINEKYGESGSLFQGAFKSRLIDEDVDFRNLAVYVMVKNPFELYPGGLQRAIENFDDAYERIAADPFNSLGVYTGTRTSPIITKDLLGELFETPDSFKDFARETMLHRLDQLTSDF
jgi:putative transposase